MYPTKSPKPHPNPLANPSRHLPIHLDPPHRTKAFHGPNGRATSHREQGRARKKPTVADGREERFGHHDPDASDDVADAVVERDPGRGVAGHELGEHGDDGAEDEHVADAEEEVGCELHGVGRDVNGMSFVDKGGISEVSVNE